jgi:hypothetical protein
MVMLSALVLSAPATWGDLLTKPVEAWDARLGVGKSGAVSKGDGDFSLRERAYRKGAIKVSFLGGKPSTVEVVLPSQPLLSWTKALSSAGLSAKGAASRSLGTTQGAEVATEQTLLTLPSLPKGVRVSFVQRRVEGRVTEQVVGVEVPSVVRLTPGAAERKAIIEAARAAVLKETRQRVIFRVTNLRVGEGWAFLAAEPRTPQDRPADWSRLAPDGFEAGAYDPIAFALLRREGGRWKTLALALGPSDVPWVLWAKEYRAPYGVFDDRRL